MSIHQVLIAVDQLGNALIGGWADETISARSWRMSKTSKHWARARATIDFIARTIFGQIDHCQHAYESELTRQDSPPEVRPKV